MTSPPKMGSCDVTFLQNYFGPGFANSYVCKLAATHHTVHSAATSTFN